MSAAPEQTAHDITSINSPAMTDVTKLVVDYRNPNYTPIFEARTARLKWLRANPRQLPLLKAYYANHVANFLSDWALTVDPRVKKPRSPVMPFLLFPKQIELIQWIEERYETGTPGVLVKSRDVGASWLAMAWGITKCLFVKDFMVGIGSAKEDKVDRSGDPDTLFYKGRMFLQWLPVEFRCGWDLGKHSAHMRLVFPETNSSVTGEAGDNIGRGGRKSVYLVDEAAHVERPLLIDASLSATTDCRIDMSSVNTLANSFAEKAHNAAIPRFDFSWLDDPRKDHAWYEKKKQELDPKIVAQEIDCNFSASADNVVIPSHMVQAAIGLAERLGLDLTGRRYCALDIADVGRDKNALASRNGQVVDFITQWSGADMDIAASVSKAYALVEELGAQEFCYDADGMGANVRGDVRVIKEVRKLADPRSFSTIRALEFKGSGAVLKPEEKARRSDVKNKDMFQNRKAQSWWHLYTMFAESWKASKGEQYDESLLISISPKLPDIALLCAELSQPQWKWMTSGKRIVDKVPDGARSPNFGDALMMCFAPRKGPMVISDAQIDRLR